MSVDVLLKQVQELPMEQRIKFARRVCDEIEESVEGAPGPQECADIDRRRQEHLESPDDVARWEEVKAKLDAKYKK